jgi:hypothetical protein
METTRRRRASLYRQAHAVAYTHHRPNICWEMRFRTVLCLLPPSTEFLGSPRVRLSNMRHAVSVSTRYALGLFGHRWPTRWSLPVRVKGNGEERADGTGRSPRGDCECGSVALQRRSQLRNWPIHLSGWRFRHALKIPARKGVLILLDGVYARGRARARGRAAETMRTPLTRLSLPTSELRLQDKFRPPGRPWLVRTVPGVTATIEQTSALSGAPRIGTSMTHWTEPASDHLC